jgi:hypothetical protein
VTALLAERWGLLPWLRRLDPLDKWLGILLASFTLIYAIFHETFWAWHRRPKLAVELDRIEIPVSFQFGQATHLISSVQVRLRVKNSGGRLAEQVETYANQLTEKCGDQWKGCSWFLPMNLIWANEEKLYTGVSPGVERVCNIVGVLEPGAFARPLGAYSERLPHKPAAFDYSKQCFLDLHTEPKTTKGSHIIFPGTYRLYLILASATAASKRITLQVSFSGSWRAGAGPDLDISII